MTDKNAFSKQNLQTIDIEKKSDIFEELNLPPEFAAFCRNNAQNIKIFTISFAILVLAWGGYDYYATSQVEVSTNAMAVAMQTKDNDLRNKKLSHVVDKHSGSDAALWSLVELGHADLETGLFKKAIERYSEALEDVDADSPLASLIHFSLAQAFEQSKETDKAIEQYLFLTADTGFSDMGNMALGRIYEQRGETIKARDAYEKIESYKVGWAKERLASLIPPKNND